MIKNNNMNGKIKGKSIWNFVMALDYSEANLNKLEDRINNQLLPILEKLRGVKNDDEN